MSIPVRSEATSRPGVFFDWQADLLERRRKAGAPTVSVVIHTLNEASNVAEAIDSVRWADEIVVVDMHSEDGTREIAERAGAKVVLHERTGIVEPARNFGVQQTSGEWILVLDADERVTEGLAEALVDASRSPSVNVVNVPRVNFIGYQALIASGWGGESHTRFFRRGFVSWGSGVHELPNILDTPLRLPHKAGAGLLHKNAVSYSHFLEKLIRYSDFEADKLEAAGAPLSWEAMLEQAQKELVNRWNPGLDGTLSATLAMTMFCYRFLSYAKYWERRGFPPLDLPETGAEALGNSQDFVRGSLVDALVQTRNSWLSSIEKISLLDTQLEEEIEKNRWIHSQMVANQRRLERLHQNLRDPRKFFPWAIGAVLVRIKRRIKQKIGWGETRKQKPLDRRDQAIRSASMLSFPQVSEPVVSVVIPVFGNLELTVDCLSSIIASQAETEYEVIVVDDKSSDDTPDQLSEIPGLKLLRNEVNSGFCATCNAGASHARGKYVVFLNNDTRVHPGWLDELVKAMKSDDKIGAVGSKLVFEDGTLQEAGGLIWRDGSGWNVGRGHNPAEDRFNFRRDVDYCSGASLMVRKDLFDALDGFDSRFSPGYYEDTDICFALRRLGYRVVYEPFSVVTHLEGMTSGNDQRPGLGGTVLKKDHQYLHQATFVEKWADELKNHHPNGVGGGLFGSRPDNRARIIVCDWRIPRWDTDAGGQMMTWVLSLLAEQGPHVTLCPANGDPTQPYMRQLQQRGIEVIANKNFEELLAERKGQYDVVLLVRPHDGGQFLEVARAHQPTAAVWYLGVDLHFVREQRRFDLTGEGDPEELAARKEYELNLIGSSDVAIVITEEEARVVSEAVPGARIAILPTVHEVASPNDIPAFRARADLIFIGGYDHDPNVDAVEYFVKEIFPLVKAKIPGCKFWILGSRAPKRVLDLRSKDVLVMGFVQDPEPFFHMSKVFVAPLRYGAGMKGKIGQALSLGIPVVTTSIGAEGMNLVDGQEALIRDDAHAFADAVVKLYQDEAVWNALSRGGRDAVSKRWTPDRMRERLLELLASESGGKKEMTGAVQGRQGAEAMPA